MSGAFHGQRGQTSAAVRMVGAVAPPLHPSVGLGVCGADFCPAPKRVVFLFCGDFHGDFHAGPDSDEGLVSGFFFCIFVFLLSGLFVIGQNDVPVTDVWQFFGSTTSILTLLILAPYFSIPIALGAYHRSALLIVRGRVRQPHSTYFILSSFTYLLATLMNVAAVAHTTFHNLTRSYSKAIADKIHFAAFTRGVVLAGIWSPGGATLGAALARVPAEPGTVIAVGFGFSLFMLMFGYVVDEGKGPALCSCAFVADTDGDAAGSRIRCPLAACRYFLWHHRYIRRRGHCPARRVGHAGHRRRHFAHFVPFIGVVAGIEETKTTVARTANKKHQRDARFSAANDAVHFRRFFDASVDGGRHARTAGAMGDLLVGLIWLAVHCVAGVVYGDQFPDGSESVIGRHDVGGSCPL